MESGIMFMLFFFSLQLVFVVEVQANDPLGFILLYESANAPEKEPRSNRLFVAGHKAKAGEKAQALLAEVHKEDANPHVAMLEHHFHLTNIQTTKYRLFMDRHVETHQLGHEILADTILYNFLEEKPKSITVGKLTYGAKVVIVLEIEDKPANAPTTRPSGTDGGVADFIVRFDEEDGDHFYITGFKATPNLKVETVIHHIIYGDQDKPDDAGMDAFLSASLPADDKKHTSVTAMKVHLKKDKAVHKVNFHVHVRQENGDIEKKALIGGEDIANHLDKNTVVINGITYEPTIFVISEDKEAAQGAHKAQPPKAAADDAKKH